MHRPTSITITIAALALAGTGVATTSATADSADSTDSADAAAAKPHTRTLAKGLVSPLSAAVAKDGTRYFSMNFTGGVFRQVPGGKPVPVYRTTGGAEAGAVSTRNGVVTFATTVSSGPTGTPSTNTHLLRRSRSGKVTTVADLGRHERRKNPDGATTYGFTDLDDACAAQLPKALGPATYTGTKDSHPYASLMTAGTTYVADAAANAILGVSASGRVRTVAVLPPVPVVITADIASANKIPDCAVGATYAFEPVPTDVELGPGGRLYVSSLPGGPEDGSTGAQGGVFRVNPRTGAVTRLASGLAGAVGLAVAKNGDVFASQLFGGQISRIPAGSSTPKPFLRVALPGDVELVGGVLYATTNVLPGAPKDPPAGKLVEIVR